MLYFVYYISFETFSRIAIVCSNRLECENTENESRIVVLTIKSYTICCVLNVDVCIR